MTEDLIERVKGVLHSGSSRERILDGMHFEPAGLTIYQRNLKDFLGALAGRAGYTVGENVEYEIRIKRK